MTKESFVDVKSRITRDEFRTTFTELDKDETIKKAIDDIQQKAKYFRLLGSYEKFSPKN